MCVSGLRYALDLFFIHGCEQFFEVIHFVNFDPKLTATVPCLRFLDHRQEFYENANKKKNEVLPERTYRNSETGGGLSGAVRIRIYVRISREGPRWDA